MRSSKLDPRCNPAPTRRQQAALVVAGGDRAPGGEALIQVDIDATVVRAHSEKEQAAPTWNKTFGIHPLAAFADHGAGAGTALAIVLRPGNAGSNTAPSTSKPPGWPWPSCPAGC